MIPYAHRLDMTNPPSGTLISVISKTTSRLMPLTKSVVFILICTGWCVMAVMYVPLNPTPSKILSIGPPKHAERAMRGYPIRATVTFATRSPSEFPTAKIVRPSIASLKRKMCPMVYSKTISINGWLGVPQAEHDSPEVHRRLHSQLSRSKRQLRKSQ